MDEPKTEQLMHFDGPCPFLTCLETGPHDHPICPDCGAVKKCPFECTVIEIYDYEP